MIRERFRKLPARRLKKLIEQGRRDAQALDKAIRSQFEMTARDAAVRLR